MTHCTNCGAALEPAAAVCPSCGTAVAGAAGGMSVASLMALARGAKGIALLCFLLPWVTVSCAGTRLASITGVQLATGKIDPIHPGAGMPAAMPAPGAARQSFSPDILLLVAAVLIAAGLIATFVMPRRRAALAAMATAAAAALLMLFDVLVRIKSAVRQQMEAGGAGTAPLPGAGDFERQMRQQLDQVTQAISVDPAIGFWLSVIALIAAIVLLKMVHGRAAGP